MIKDARAAVLVTGGAGYIGSHTCKALADAGYLPVTLDNLVHGHRSAVRWGPFVEGDLADTRLVRHTLESHRVQAVVHFAGFAYVGESMGAPLKYFRNNTAHTGSLLEAMEAANVDRIVFSSTCATYGMPVKLPISEDHPQRPINPYGESKLFVERMLAWQEKAHGLKWMALRYFNAAGADASGELGEDHDPETHLIPLVLDAAWGRRPSVDIYGTDYDTRDGTAVRDYIHVTDLADAHVAALQKLGESAPGGGVNLGTGRGHTVREVIATAEAVTGRKVPVREAARRPGDPAELVADPARAASLLGWQARHSDLRNIISTAWTWHSQRHGRTAAA